MKPLNQRTFVRERSCRVNNRGKVRGAGFTLIEVLVAVAIFGLLSVLAYGALGNLLDTRARLDAEREFWRDLSLTFMRMGDDLAHARARPARDTAGFPLPAFRGQPVDPRPLGEPSLELTRGGELEFSSGRRSDLRRVAWRLNEGRLERLVWPVLDQAPASKTLDSPLLRDVELFELQFIAIDGTRHDRWPPPGSAVVGSPRAVEVKLELKEHGEFTRLFLVNE
jgi:general secretion pathway protein J